ncbi:MAG: methyltransferase domain-containing protein [Woeseia sp.]
MKISAMPDAAPLLDIFSCPRCDKAPLEQRAKALRCGGCGTEFPLVSGIPCLFADPQSSLGEWRNRLHFELQRLAHNSERLRAELRPADLGALAKRRLTGLLAATESHRKALQKLLAPLDVQSMQASYESHLALRTRLPIDQALGTYYANVHRDWAWGDDENAASLEQIRHALVASTPSGNPVDKIGDTLILGSGASRLAYDVHMTFNPPRSVALDFNPLLLLIAQSVVSGIPLDLYEFPMAPKTIDDVAVLRTLRAPTPVRNGLSFVLADVLRAPFCNASFDTVVTPWLIDIVAEDLPYLAARINRLLKKGGRWVNFGSLAFEHPQHSRCYSPEETIEIVERCGFSTPDIQEAIIPYMCSPASRHGRRELTFTFAAVKSDDAKPPQRSKALPDWIVTGREPVPLLPSFRTQALSTQIYSFIMSLIDGRRSIADMAAILEQRKLMTRQEAEPAIRNFLARMYDDSQRRREF